MFKKAHSFMLVFLVAFALVLSGCSSSSDTSKEKETGGGTKTIKFMHLWPAGSSKQQNLIVNDIIKQFEAKNPNIKVQVEVLDNEQYKNKIKVLSSSNSLPDVGFTWSAGYLDPFVKGNLMAPLDDLLNSGLKDSFVKGTTEAYAVNGKTYGLPLELNITPIYYNKAIFKKYNLDVPKTFSDFQNVVKTLASNGVEPLTLGNKDRWTGSIQYVYLADRIAGPKVVNDAISGKTSFDNPAMVTAAKDIQWLVNNNGFNKGFNGLSNDEAKADFYNGKSAMYMMGTWELPNLTTNPDTPQSFKDNVGYFKFPTVEGGKSSIDSWVGGPGVGLFVAQNSKVKPEAKKFVKFFIEKWGEQSVTKAGVIPATKVDTSKVKLPQLYIDILNDLNKATNLTLFADVQMTPAVAQKHLDLIQSLYGNQVTPEQFAKQTEDAIKAGK